MICIVERPFSVKPFSVKPFSVKPFSVKPFVDSPFSVNPLCVMSRLWELPIPLPDEFRPEQPEAATIIIANRAIRPAIEPRGARRDFIGRFLTGAVKLLLWSK